jgi:hypothetical protein
MQVHVLTVVLLQTSQGSVTEELRDGGGKAEAWIEWKELVETWDGRRLRAADEAVSADRP